MKTFENIKFHGTFRTYQQKVLDNLKNITNDKRMHIVAAPGSGKTILGLEIIRRLNAPALVFSPSITIKQQWGDRFSSNFLNKEMKEEDYFSYSLKSLKLITSSTYQSLHSAMNRLVDNNEQDEYNEKEKAVDYTDFDLIAEVKKANIKTICLDEAHHLRSEWQKSLENFLKQLGNDVHIVSLTATPPYDSTPAEWQRYISVCGEIDEEIFVPELVAQKTLCPHQDYIYFNYPTEDEKQTFIDYKEKAIKTVNTIGNAPEFNLLIQNIIENFENQDEIIYSNAKQYIAIFSYANFMKISIPNSIIKKLTLTKKLPEFDLNYAEVALQFIIDNPTNFIESNVEAIKNILLENGLIHKKKVNLNSNEKLDRMLISSKGKLNSIAEIAKVECSALKDKLRMLVLTDYIKKDMLKVVGSEESLNVISIISVFEKLRRNLDKSAKLAILSGTLVVLPVSCLDVLADVSIIYNIKYTTKEINNTGYYEIKFKGSNKNKVSIITQIFEMGYINILIGTKSLLGEGWDSPCINSLILASFVGSFMLSNQMRGRAIRIDKNNPEKVSNIWHLTTIEPPMLFAKTLEDKTNAKLIDNTKIIHSNDYNTLTRRFECFLGPSYSKDVIESGINRLGEVVCPPYTESHFEEINQKMVELAVNRDALREKWERCVGNGENTAVREVVAVDKKAVKYPKSFYYFNYGLLILLFALECVVTINFFSYNSFEYNLKSVLYILFSVVILYVFLKVLVCILKFISPQKILKTLSKTVLKTLEDMGEIKSIKPRLVVNLVDEVGACIEVMLENVTTYEQNIFTTAVTEMFSAIDNPRYLIIKKSIIKNKLKYKYSFACPAIIGNKKENAQILEKYFSKNDGKYLVVYTRNEQGREHLIKSRKHSFINKNENLINAIERKKKVSPNYT